MNNTVKITTIIVFLGNISMYKEILRNTCKVGKFFRIVGKVKNREINTQRNYIERVYFLWLIVGTKKTEKEKSQRKIEKEGTAL